MRYFQHKSQKAEWSARIALLFLVLFLLTLLFHRTGIPQFDIAIPSYTVDQGPVHFTTPAYRVTIGPLKQLSTPTAMKLLGVAITAAAVAVGLGMTALVSIWREGHTGAGNATVGVLVGLVMLAMPLKSLPSLLTLPRLHEVSTDTIKPPAFEALAERRRTTGANPVAFQRSEAELQTASYPDLKPLTINRPYNVAYDVVQKAVERLGWTLAGTPQPPTPVLPGKIEASARSLVFGLTDDVVIRISATGRDTRVDVRSSSRHGEHDLGRNAEHVRDFYAEVKTRLDEIEKSERLERAVAARELRVKKARAEKEAAMKERARKERAARRAAIERRQASNAQSNQGAPGASQSQPQPSYQGAQEQSKRRQSGGSQPSLGKFWELLTR